MVKITDLKVGDVVKIIDEGVERDGVVEDISREENMACVFNGVQEFWYTPEEILPVRLTENELLMLGFERVDTEDGVKYMKGPFRVLVHDPVKFSNMEVWYREDRRHFDLPLYVHELQNHYLQMTKVPLEKPLTQ